MKFLKWTHSRWWKLLHKVEGGQTGKRLFTSIEKLCIRYEWVVYHLSSIEICSSIREFGIPFQKHHSNFSKSLRISCISWKRYTKGNISSSMLNDVISIRELYAQMLSICRKLATLTLNAWMNTNFWKHRAPCVWCSLIVSKADKISTMQKIPPIHKHELRNGSRITSQFNR